MELRFSEKASVIYHNIFDYPLTKDELNKWKCSKKIKSKTKTIHQNNFYLLKGRETIIKKRLENEKYSKNKLKIAKSAAKLISKIPTVKFVGITGALAMRNASKNSDIDLMIITTSNLLWTSRLFVYGLLLIKGYKLRSPNNKDEKNKLCLNIWLSENDLEWKKRDRNIYIAHEIAQVVPIYNIEKTYEKLLGQNKWILSFWPNATKVISNKDIKLAVQKNKNFITLSLYIFISFFEKIAFKIQYLYMKKRITREIVIFSRALFHPNDWAKIVIEKLSS